MKLRDVAKMANVSVGTASMSLSRHPLVAASTRNRVLRVANQLGYRRNIHARSLAANKSFLLGFLGRQAYWSFAMDVIRGMQEVSLARGYSLLTYIHGDSAQDESKHLEISRERRVDGVVVMPALDPDGRNNGKELQSLRDEGFPVVQLFSNVIEGLPSVRVDTAGATRQSVEHLLKLGHRRIAYMIFADFADQRIEGFYREELDRYRAYEQTMRDAGESPLLFTHPGFNFLEEGERLAQAILDHPDKPTAVITYSDAHAWGLMRGVVRAGRRIPEDLSVIGAHRLNFINVELPEITTFIHPHAQMGRSAAELCFKMLDNQPVEDVLLMPHFQKGGTVRSIR